MENIAIYGAGGYGREVACLINQINDFEHKWNIVGFFDDQKEKGTMVSHFGRIIGGIEELNNYPNSLALVIAVGNPAAIRGIRERIVNDDIYYPNIISPNFGVSDRMSFSIGEGNIIGNGCAVSCDVSIGNFNILNADIVMGHDSSIGNFNVLMPDIRVSGEVEIGEENYIGVGSIIIQRIKIGKQVHIGAGSVVMTKPKNGGTYIGNPAKLFNY